MIKREKSLDMTCLAEIGRLIHEAACLMVMALLYMVESADFVFLKNQIDLTWGDPQLISKFSH